MSENFGLFLAAMAALSKIGKQTARDHEEQEFWTSFEADVIKRIERYTGAADETND